MKTVREVAASAGVSVRTLHYYDQIGLLRPAAATAAGYRLYDSAALERLGRILFFRELGFPLAQIGRILDSPAFDPRETLERQRALLVLERERYDRLIGLVDRILEGDETMNSDNLNAFDRGEIDALRRQYAAEAQERWGDTDAWRESERRTAADWEDAAAEADEIFSAFVACRDRGRAPGDEETQALVVRWQEAITARCYTCTDEILAGLGELYVADERFRRNIDRHGAGLAAFVREAIRIRCRP